VVEITTTLAQRGQVRAFIVYRSAARATKAEVSVSWLIAGGTLQRPYALSEETPGCAKQA